MYQQYRRLKEKKIVQACNQSSILYIQVVDIYTDVIKYVRSQKRNVLFTALVQSEYLFWLASQGLS